MEIKTKFNIGDTVYYIDNMRNSGITVDKYVIDDLKIYKGLKDEINIQYNIHNPRMAQDRHTVHDDEIYLLKDVDKVLNIIKDIIVKENK